VYRKREDKRRGAENAEKRKTEVFCKKETETLSLPFFSSSSLLLLFFFSPLCLCV
jgi:hypothetical protein